MFFGVSWGEVMGFKRGFVFVFVSFLHCFQASCSCPSLWIKPCLPVASVHNNGILCFENNSGVLCLVLKITMGFRV